MIKFKKLLSFPLYLAIIILDFIKAVLLFLDLKNGNYISIDENRPCDILCPGGDCCDNKAQCTCGTTTGHYTCICQKGYYGSGLRNSCLRKYISLKKI